MCTLAESKRSGVFVPVAIATSQVGELASEQTSECWSYKSAFDSPLSDRRWKQVHVVHRSTATTYIFIHQNEQINTQKRSTSKKKQQCPLQHPRLLPSAHILLLSSTAASIALSLPVRRFTSAVYAVLCVCPSVRPSQAGIVPN